MRGFLRHLAAGAIRPQTSVHPFPESVYSAARPHSTAEASPLIAPSAPTPSLERPITHIAQAAALSARNQSPDSSLAQPDVETPVCATLRSFQPLLPQTDPESIRTSDRFSQLFHPSGSDSPVHSPQEAKHPEGERSGDGLDRVVVSLPAAADLPIARPLPLVPLASQQLLAPQVKAARVAPAAPRSYADAPHGDDIQIHIGRVEVIAVQPAEPRRTPAPPRKGLSLDDYLSRRNGRIG